MLSCCKMWRELDGSECISKHNDDRVLGHLPSQKNLFNDINFALGIISFKILIRFWFTAKRQIPSHTERKTWLANCWSAESGAFFHLVYRAICSASFMTVNRSARQEPSITQFTLNFKNTIIFTVNKLLCMRLI